MKEYTKDDYKTIEEFPKYEINCYGTIRNVKTKKLKYVCGNKNVYLMVQFKLNKKVLTRKVHRLVAECFLPPPSASQIEECKITSPSGKVYINHIDGNKLNNFYKNLEWCTPAQNNQHSWDTGLSSAPKGEINGRSVLTEEKVHEVCKAFEQGMQPKEAQEVFGISRPQATKIRSGYAWKHVWEQYNIKVNRRKK